MTSWQSGVIEANGIRLHYTRTGAGEAGAKPPVVLAHGFSDDGLCWTSVAQALAPTYDVIMVDARGHGRSDAPEQGYGPAEHADDLAGVITGLQLRQPIIVGHSMGAATTLTLAGVYPDLPRAIVLEDPPAWWMPTSPQPSSDDEWQKRMRVWIMGLKRKPREAIIADQRAAAPAWSDVELGPWADSKLRLNLNVFNRRSPSDMNWSAILQGITCPALLITGDLERGAIVTEEQAVALQALVPHLRIAHVPGAGHNIRRDQFARFMDVVRPFLVESI